MAKKIVKKKKSNSNKLKTVKYVWIGRNSKRLENINKNIQDKIDITENSNEVAAISKEREFASFAQVASDYTTKLDLLTANTIKLKRLFESATKQIEEPLKKIQEVNEVFAKHL